MTYPLLILFTYRTGLRPFIRPPLQSRNLCNLRDPQCFCQLCARGKAGLADTGKAVVDMARPPKELGAPGRYLLVQFQTIIHKGGETGSLPP